MSANDNAAKDMRGWTAEEEWATRDMRDRLRVLRLHLGLTALEMARRLDMSVAAYKNREGGPIVLRRGWTLFLCRLADEFDVSIDWMCHGTKCGLPRNDRCPITPDLRPIRPRFRLVAGRTAA
jgi:transcriptional regulator with XRE-family HTH domain